MASILNLRFVSVTAIALATTVASAIAAPAEPTTAPTQNAAAIDPKEGISTDDIKDVFEAIKFIMVSLGVGAALYWFWFHYLPSREFPRIEFDVDVEQVGENDATWMIEIVALVRNRGRKGAELTELRFALESVLADRLPEQGGSLAKLNALTPLFEGEWSPATFVLDAGTQSRRAVAVAIPKTVNQIVVTAMMRNVNRAEVYAASRLVSLSPVTPIGFG